MGSPVPAFTPHAVSVSLPTWEDNIGYEEGDKRVVDAMVTGYPRFFIHRSIQKVRPLMNELRAYSDLAPACPDMRSQVRRKRRAMSIDAHRRYRKGVQSLHC